jgi:hypothetical protein
MAEPSPQQNLSIIVNNVIDVAQVPTVSGPTPPQKELPRASEDDFETLPDPLHGTTDHVEPSSWAFGVMNNIHIEAGRESWPNTYIRSKNAIREPSRERFSFHECVIKATGKISTKDIRLS